MNDKNHRTRYEKATTIWDSRIKQLYKNISTKVSEMNIHHAMVEEMFCSL